MNVCWASFWLGLFTPSMTILAVLVVAGILTDVINWLAPQEPWL